MNSVCSKRQEHGEAQKKCKRTGRKCCTYLGDEVESGDGAAGGGSGGGGDGTWGLHVSYGPTTVARRRENEELEAESEVAGVKREMMKAKADRK